MYGLEPGGKRAVGFTSCPRAWMYLRSSRPRFKFARQKSKLAGVIRGSFFVIKGEY